MSPKRIGILGVDGVAALQFTAPIETCLAAALDDGYGGRISCYTICTIGLGTAPFRAESGMLIATEETLKTAPPLDTIIIPGGAAWRNRAVVEVVAGWLLERAVETPRMAAICNGLYPLARTGILGTSKVSISWRYASDLARRHPELRIEHRKPLIKDGPFFTCTGVSAGMNLALALIEEDYGPYLARSVAQETQILLPADNNAAASLLPGRPIDRFGELVSWMMRNLEGDLSIEQLARRACMSKESFTRAFKSVFGVPPAQFVETLRLNEARRRLSVPHRTLQTVAASVGYANSGKFSHAFERRFGVRPHRVLEGSPGTVKRSVAA